MLAVYLYGDNVADNDNIAATDLSLTLVVVKVFVLIARLKKHI